MKTKNIRIETKKNGMLIDFRPDLISLIPRRIKKQLRANCVYGRSAKLSVIRA
ncbi:hypothetical protein [Bacillus hominis]|uniref:hypothetical protein n=1 Tax=Bacillus hominis TaxID=2817478 RepID=UPI001BB2F204|nr:hypothetical protein [Bacillus hominis]